MLVGGASVNVVNPNVYKSLPYDPVNDLLPAARIGLLPFMLIVNPAVPATTAAELVAYAKKNPGKLSYGTPTRPRSWRWRRSSAVRAWIS